MDNIQAVEILKANEERKLATDYCRIKNMAIEALEKGISKHIEEQTEDDREFIDYVCPNCKTTLQQKMKDAIRTTIYKYKHCHWCGQKLDWSDVDG